MPKSGVHTAEVLLFLNKLFDAFNGVKKGDVPNEFRCPMTSTSYHYEFFKSAKAFVRKMRFLNKETQSPESATVPCLKNLVITIEGYMQLCKLLPTIGLQELNGNYLNQDPLENFFGTVRSHGIKNEKPTCYQFGCIFKCLLITNFSSSHSIGRNCAPDQGEFIVSWAKYRPPAKTSVPVDTKIPFSKEPKLLEKTYSTKLSNINEAFLKDKKVKSLRSCLQCQCFFNNVNSHLQNLYQSVKPVLQTVVSKLYTVDNLRKKVHCFLRKEIDFSCFNCIEHKNILKDKYLNTFFQKYVDSVTTTINRVLSGQLEIERRENHSVLVSAHVRYNKTLQKCNRKKLA